ncbi:MAG: sensor histidine kinase, partial [Microcystaceae cyanobacterium]
SATNQMEHLVEDLLLLARTDNDLDLISQALNKIPLDELLEDVVTLVEPQADQKSIAINVNFQDQVTIKGDPFQLQRLFINLLDNAVKYTPEKGKVNLIVQATDKWVMIGIEDTGIGIGADQLSLVFDRFWRSEKARSRKDENGPSPIKGTGLGLAIAQSIAKRHGGEITVKSILGKGSCFTVRLPVLALFTDGNSTIY